MQITPRTIDELKIEIDARASRQSYPLNGLPLEDVRSALRNIKTTDPDEWGAAWIAVGETYLAKAREVEPARPDEARALFRRAYELFNFGRWPVPSSEKKRTSAAMANAAFQEFARLAEPAVEYLRIPFGTQSIIAYLQKPLAIAPVPVIIDIGGVDHWKEKILLESGPILAKGIAVLAVDMPGTGDAIFPLEPGAERIYSAVIDYLLMRSDINSTKIMVRGQSWGSHWALRTALHESARLCAGVFQSGPVHLYFQPDWFLQSLNTREYLFDFVPSRLHVFGKKSIEEAAEYLPLMSLLDNNAIDGETPAMLLIGGVNDSQTPFGDIELLMRHGSPKEVWVNPKGGHMGRSPEISDRQIFQNVTIPWIVARAAHFDSAPEVVRCRT